MPPYDRYPPAEFLLRDWLAIDRTLLAAERTLLSWLRTALGLGLGGITLARLFPDDAAVLLAAGVGVVTGVASGVAGAVRYVRLRRRFAALADTAERAPR